MAPLLPELPSHRTCSPLLLSEVVVGPGVLLVRVGPELGRGEVGGSRE